MQLTPADIEQMCERFAADGRFVFVQEMKLVIGFLALVDQRKYYGAGRRDCLVGQVAQAIRLWSLAEHMSPVPIVAEWSGVNSDDVEFIYGQVAEMAYIYNYGAALEMACRELGVDLDEARALYEAELARKEREGARE